MKTLFNDGWSFFELPIDENDYIKDEKYTVISPDDYFKSALDYEYKPVSIPHDWMISSVNALYRNSVGFYKKTFSLNENQIINHHNAIRFEGIYMNCAIWINGKKAGDWKYGYSTFELDISNFLKAGENLIQVIVVYQNCNTRWYSGAGIFRDVFFISTGTTYLPTDGVYFVARPESEKKLDDVWTIKISTEIEGNTKGYSLISKINDKNGNLFAQTQETLAESITTQIFTVHSPKLWNVDAPEIYTLTTQLLDEENKIVDEITQNCGFKSVYFDCNKGLFLNGKHLKIQGACHHHDHGALGAAFNGAALHRQFSKLKEMGVNAIRCSHNPPTEEWMNLADEMGFLVDDEAFDMWENNKTPFDYANYFDDWCERDATNLVKKDRNHPCLLMWSIGNEISDTNEKKGIEITKKLYKIFRKNDPEKNALITSASNYMMNENPQLCADELDLVGYNYLEKLYYNHHEKHPEWKIYGSETASTVQSRGIYHFPESLKLITFSDGQCSSLGNCTTPWGAANTQFLLTFERDCKFSAGQFIWTGWDYIGEPTPYHSKNSYFGQIDTAGFPKDSFYLYKAMWAGKKTEPFVHILPYWDWNEGQLIDIKAYSNADEVELFVNGKSFGRQKIDFENAAEPFGKWQAEYHKGEIKVIAYNDGEKVAEETKKSFEDPAEIIMEPEVIYSGASSKSKNKQNEKLHFIDIMTVDKKGTPVENARNYITFNVTGKAQLVGLDNGDSTDYDEYQPESGNSLSRKLFSNRLVAIIRAKGSFVITAASKDLPTVSMKFDGQKWSKVAPYYAIRAEKDYVPIRKIELSSESTTELSKNNSTCKITAKIYPENSTDKEIEWNPVLKECIPADNIEVQSENGVTYCRKISAKHDGECILRCTAKNCSNLEQVTSDIPFKVNGFGKSYLNPYKLIEACRFSRWNEKNDKPKICLESGIMMKGTEKTWVSFDQINFGEKGSDILHLPLFSFNTEVPIEIWENTPETNGKCLGEFIYRHKSIYNTYNENIFKLNHKLTGIRTISFIIPDGVYFKGFFFE